MAKYEIENTIIKEVSEKYLEEMNGFCSFQKDLKDYLIDDSLNHQNNLISKTFLWFDKDTGKLVGYLTICNDSIRLSNIKRALQKKT